MNSSKWILIILYKDEILKIDFIYLGDVQYIFILALLILSIWRYIFIVNL